MAIEKKLVVSWNKYILFNQSPRQLHLLGLQLFAVAFYFPHLVSPRSLSIDPSSSLILQISVQIPPVAVSLARSSQKFPHISFKFELSFSLNTLWSFGFQIFRAASNFKDLWTRTEFFWNFLSSESVRTLLQFSSNVDLNCAKNCLIKTNCWNLIINF